MFDKTANIFLIYEIQQISNQIIIAQLTQMILPVKFVIVFSLLLFDAFCLDNQYVWMDYSLKTKLNVLDGGKYKAILPCKAKINECTAQYTLLPMGWSAASDGSLIIPSEDIKKSGAFTIKGTFSDDFGEQIDLQLVAQISNELLTVTDMSQFLNKNGYSSKNTQSKPLKPVYDIKIIENPQGFPTLNELQDLIKTGSVYDISTKLKQVSEKSAPCDTKLAYLTQLQQYLNNKIFQNTVTLKSYELGLNQIQDNIAILQNEKKTIQNKTYSQSTYIQNKKKLYNLTSFKSEAQMNVTKFQYLANRYLQNFKKISGAEDDSNNTKEAQQIKKIEQQIQSLNQIIKQSQQKKKKLEQTLKMRKKISQKPVQKKKEPYQAQLMSLYESKYRQYSGLAVDAKIRLKSIDQQISSLNSKISIQSADIASSQDKIKQAKQKLADYLSPNQIQNQLNQKNDNQVLKLSSDNMQTKINTLKFSKCSYF